MVLDDNGSSKNQWNHGSIPCYSGILHNIWISFLCETIVDLSNVVVRDLAQWQRDWNQEIGKNNNLENNGWEKNINTK